MIGSDELKENDFIKEDSYGWNGLNLHTYVQNNYINYIDPSGYCKEKDDFQKDNYRSIDLTNGIYMYDPNSQLAQYIYDVKGLTYLLFNELVEKAF